VHSDAHTPMRYDMMMMMMMMMIIISNELVFVHSDAHSLMQVSGTKFKVWFNGPAQIQTTLFRIHSLIRAHARTRYDRGG
jgi:hypothetical protein